MIKIPVSNDGCRFIRIPFFKNEWKTLTVISNSEDDYFTELIFNNTIYGKVESSKKVSLININAVLRENGTKEPIGSITQHRIVDDGKKYDTYGGFTCIFSDKAALVPSCLSVTHTTFLPGSDKYGTVLNDDIGITSVDTMVSPHCITYTNEVWGCIGPLAEQKYRYYNRDLTRIYEEGFKTGDMEIPICRYHYDNNDMLTKVETFPSQKQRDYDITYSIHELIDE